MNFADFKKQFNEKLYDEYAVTMCLYDIAGGTPANPDMIKGWIDAVNKERSAEERAALANATIAEFQDLAEEKESCAWVRFKRDDKGPYIEGRCLKAALKESANIIKSQVKMKDKKGKEKGATALKSKVAECVFVVEERVHILKDGKRVNGDIPSEERPVHVMTRQGPRTSLKRTDVLKDVEIRFTVRLAKTGAVSEEALFSAIAYLEHLGIGADRSQGRGRSKDIDVQKID